MCITRTIDPKKFFDAKQLIMEGKIVEKIGPRRFPMPHSEYRVDIRIETGIEYYDELFDETISQSFHFRFTEKMLQLIEGFEVGDMVRVYFHSMVEKNEPPQHKYLSFYKLFCPVKVEYL